MHCANPHRFSDPIEMAVQLASKLHISQSLRKVIQFGRVRSAGTATAKAVNPCSDSSRAELVADVVEKYRHGSPHKHPGVRAPVLVCRGRGGPLDVDFQIGCSPPCRVLMLVEYKSSPISLRCFELCFEHHTSL